MLSTSQAARALGVSPARVRALIAKGVLPATKVGNAWTIDEAYVARRIERPVKAGRPRKPSDSDGKAARTQDGKADALSETTHQLYLSCKQSFHLRPDRALIESAESPEEASFYIAVSDFFIRQSQASLVENGAF